MALTSTEMLIFTLAVAAGAFLSRVLPFVVFPPNKPLPKSVTYLGNVLPPAMLALLVMECFKETQVLKFPYAIPEVVSVGIVVVLHLYKKNALLSIFGGTAMYIVFTQFIFV